MGRKVMRVKYTTYVTKADNESGLTQLEIEYPGGQGRTLAAS